ncbi:MAG: hypothetical protein QM582_15725 [Micropruina sp.]|uniref:hypothetical protein n=1 Tax=Micropruina sp. TaxID=2737536 RepID=UPI0039E5CC62
MNNTGGGSWGRSGGRLRCRCRRPVGEGLIEVPLVGAVADHHAVPDPPAAGRDLDAEQQLVVLPGRIRVQFRVVRHARGGQVRIPGRESGDGLDGGVRTSGRDDLEPDEPEAGTAAGEPHRGDPDRPIGDVDGLEAVGEEGSDRLRGDPAVRIWQVERRTFSRALLNGAAGDRQGCDCHRDCDRTHRPAAAADSPHGLSRALRCS